jgi:excisionase family DNA binding protein
MKRTAHDEASELLRPEDAASFLGVKVDTLASWRCTKAHRIPYYKVGRLVYYRRHDLESFLDSCVIDRFGQEEG